MFVESGHQSAKTYHRDDVAVGQPDVGCSLTIVPDIEYLLEIDWRIMNS